MQHIHDTVSFEILQCVVFSLSSGRFLCVTLPLVSEKREKIAILTAAELEPSLSDVCCVVHTTRQKKLMGLGWTRAELGNQNCAWPAWFNRGTGPGTLCVNDLACAEPMPIKGLCKQGFIYKISSSTECCRRPIRALVSSSVCGYMV